MFTNRGRISSVGRALDCRAEGRGFNSRGRTNTQGLKITENSVPNKCFRAKYLDTQIKCFFFFFNNIDFLKLCFIVVRLMSTALVLFFAKCASDNFQILKGVTNKWCL